MVSDYRHLLLKAFNAEFDAIRKTMRHSTYNTAVNKLTRLEEQLDKLGETANVTISGEYYQLKINELNAWHRDLLHRERLKQERKLYVSTTTNLLISIDHCDAFSPSEGLFENV